MGKLTDFDAVNAADPGAASHLLFKWLCDDTDRAALYRELLNSNPKRVLKFQSRANTRQHPWDAGPDQFQQDAYLITARAHVEQAFKSSQGEFSNSPFEGLGGGNFMLGLDKGQAHDDQRRFAQAYLALTRQHIDALCTISFRAAAVMPLKTRKFDMVALAEQTALRFVGFLFGFAQADHGLLESCLKKISKGLDYQMYGRHFVSDPAVLPDNSAAMALLGRRAAALIDLYRQQIGTRQVDEHATLQDELKDIREFEDLDNHMPLAGFEPVMRRMAAGSAPGPAAHPPLPRYTSTELAVIVVGLIAGTVSNVQSAAAIAVRQFMSDPHVWTGAHDEAINAWQQSGLDAGPDTGLKPYVWEALRLNPPAAFLPRKTTQAITLGSVYIPEGSLILIGVGGATRDLAYLPTPDTFDPARKVEDPLAAERYPSTHTSEPPITHDPLIFGGDPNNTNFFHQCVGQHLAMPLITHIVRQTLLLPGVAEVISPRTGRPEPLEKLWGYNALSYPLEYQRFQRLKQTPLFVVMRVKTPTAEHAEKLKLVIRYAAPRIEKMLMDSGHVHFASFMFLENDSKLALMTVYDRDFDAYVGYFASRAGALFDRIFEHIEDAPPMPVNEFPKEFVDTIRRFNQRPVGDYFFSAYPTAEASAIQHQFN